MLRGHSRFDPWGTVGVLAAYLLRQDLQGRTLPGLPNRPVVPLAIQPGHPGPFQLSGF